MEIFLSAAAYPVLCRFQAALFDDQREEFAAVGAKPDKTQRLEIPPFLQSGFKRNARTAPPENRRRTQDTTDGNVPPLPTKKAGYPRASFFIPHPITNLHPTDTATVTTALAKKRIHNSISKKFANHIKI